MASRNAHPTFEHFTSSLGQCFWCARALVYFPFQSHPWLWHSTASSLVMWSRAILTAILDAWNSLRHIGHFGFAVDLVSCRRQTRHPEWPQLKLTGFNMALKLNGMGKKSIIILCAWNTQLISTQRATYQNQKTYSWTASCSVIRKNSAKSKRENEGTRAVWTTAVKRLNCYFCFLLLGFHLPVREKWEKMYKSVSQHNYLSIFRKILSFFRWKRLALKENHVWKWRR